MWEWHSRFFKTCFMKKYKGLIALFFSLVFIFIIFLFRQVPAGKFWEGYSILYVPVQSSDQIVIDALTENKIEGYISLSNQFMPLKISEKSPEYAMLLINKNLKEYSYLYDRNKYFFDKDNTYRVYYIPESYKSKLPSVLNYLAKWNISGNIDSDTAYPWILPAVCLVLAVLLGLFSKNRIPYYSAAVFPVVFVLCNPFYPAALSSCLLFLIILFISNIWRRKGAVSSLINRYIIFVILAVSVVSGFASSVKTGFMNLLNLAGITCVVFFCYEIQGYFIQKRNFSFVLIRPAKFISLYSGKAKIILNAVLVSMLVILSALFITNRGMISTEKTGKVMLPSSQYTDNSELPQLEDYYRWSWNVMTYPYRSINSSAMDDRITYSRYRETEEKIIKEDRIFVYDNEYKENMFNQIDELNFNSIESLLKTQKKESTTSYSSTGGMQISTFYLVMCLICFFILLFIYISIMINKGVRK